LLTNGASSIEAGYSIVDGPAGDESRQTVRNLFPRSTSLRGGAAFGPVDDMPMFRGQAADWVEGFEEAGLPGLARTWREALPFISVGNGDFIALDIAAAGDSPDDPPVVYLSHDGDGGMLGKSLSDFLTMWEQLRYIGPESWLFDPFREADGTINPAGAAAATLRKFLG
jgi:hypothetical protein